MPGTAASGGRNKKSTQDVIRQGTFRNDRHGDHQTPEPPKGTPEPPKPLEGDAREEWDRMVERLTLSGSLSVVDDAALYQYCCLFAETEELAVRAERAAASVALLEDNVPDLKGAELVALFQEISKMARLEAGYATQIRQGRMAIRQYLVEFGQTPAARSRVKVSAPKEKSKVEQFQLRKVGG